MSDTITLDDLLTQCDQAMERMSVKNHHRWLIAQCKLALIELSRRLPQEHTHGLSNRTDDNLAYAEVSADDRSVHVP